MCVCVRACVRACGVRARSALLRVVLVLRLTRWLLPSLLVQVMAKALEKGEAWVKKEAKRLAGLLSSDSIAKSKKTDLSLRKNVLAAFEA
ncbi:hypothetical protein EON62_02220 [archaeon]|nr:MAG: hypothetical protein EON62_02220 [archaeon]